MVPRIAFISLGITYIPLRQKAVKHESLFLVPVSVSSRATLHDQFHSPSRVAAYSGEFRRKPGQNMNTSLDLYENRYLWILGLSITNSRSKIKNKK